MSLERRNSARSLLPVKVRETNGDYFYSWAAADLSEDGIFLVNKLCFSDQDSHSKLTFTLPDGTHLKDLTARIVRETRQSRHGRHAGCAFEFMNLSEDQRIALKRYLVKMAS